jgi:hypothetical protein
VIKFFKEWKPLIKGVIVSLLVFKAVSIATAAAQALLGMSMMLMPLGSIIKTIWKLVKVQGIWNLVMMANPVGLLTLALLALGAAIAVVIWKHDDLTLASEKTFHKLEYDVRLWAYRFKKITVEAINSFYTLLNKAYTLLGIDIKIPKFDFGLKDDLKQLKDLSNLIDGLGAKTVKRGVAGIPGRKGVESANAKVKRENVSPLVSLAKKFGVSTEILQAAKKQEQAREQALANDPVVQFYANIAFENAPPGTKLKGTKTKGAKRVNAKVLGVNK